MCLEEKHRKGWFIAPLAKNMIFFLQSYLLNGTKMRLRNGNGKEDKQEPMALKCFMKNKAEIVYNHCRSAGLREVGIDDELFDNNDPESINALIKKWENREKSDIPKFVSDMKELHGKLHVFVYAVFLSFLLMLCLLPL